MSESSKRILIKYKDYKKKQEIMQHVGEKHEISSYSTIRKLRHSNAELVELSSTHDIHTIAATLHDHPDVHYAQPDYPLEACAVAEDDKFFLEWGMFNAGQSDRYGNKGTPGLDIDILNAWKITKGEKDVVVAVVDTGVDINHIDLRDNIYKAPPDLAFVTRQSDEVYHGLVEEWDFMDNDTTGYDSIPDSKHGTEVAGIIAAADNNKGVTGVAPNVTLLPLKFMNSHNGNTSDAIEAIEYAKALGVKIVNCSWGDFNLNPALKYHMENADMLFICAAGNKGINIEETPFYPACFELPNILTVAALNNRGELWLMSNFGKHIDVAAPGSSIISTISCMDNCSYDYDSGTSLAVPYATGIAALLYSRYRSLTPDQIKSLIVDSVKAVSGLWDKVKTGGMINAYEALSLADKRFGAHE